MTIKRRQRLFAWILLSVFIPILLLSAMHRHVTIDDSDVECSACVNHVHHAGHISVASFDAHNCVLCQYCGISFLPALSLASVLVLLDLVFINNCFLSAIPTAVVGLHLSRAPPVLLF